MDLDVWLLVGLFGVVMRLSAVRLLCLLTNLLSLLSLRVRVRMLICRFVRRALI